MAAVPDSATWVPETRYARNGDVHIAYQVWGEGEITFVGLPGIVSNLDVIWEDPESPGYLTGLGSFARMVVYDKRGQGCLTATQAYRRSTTALAISRRSWMRPAQRRSCSEESPRAERPPQCTQRRTPSVSAIW